MRKQNKITLILLISILLTSLSCIGGGGGSSTNAKSCVRAEIDVIDKSGSKGQYVDVSGTVYNSCSTEVRYALVYVTCYSASGTVLARDPEYVEEIPANGKGYFESPLSSESGSISKCGVEITEAKY